MATLGVHMSHILAGRFRRLASQQSTYACLSLRCSESLDKHSFRFRRACGVLQATHIVPRIVVLKHLGKVTWRAGIANGPGYQEFDGMVRRLAA
jgi:hypothetical protein